MGTTINQAIQAFPNYVQLQGNTKSTAQAYLCDLMQFKGFINEKYKGLVYVDKLNRGHVMDYLLCLQKGNKYRQSTLNRKSDSLIVFCRYLYEMKYNDENILSACGYKRVKNRLMVDASSDFNPYIFSDLELENLIYALQNSSDKNKYRDLAIFVMLIELGIRRSTLLMAKWEDINFVEKTMILHHVKDQITTTVQISTNLSNVLGNYRFVSGKKSGYIFMSNKNQQLSKSAFNDLIKKYLTKIGVSQKGATAHSFRHTFITKALKQNISPYKIIKYTGHRDISSLKPYANLVANDLSDVCMAVCLPITLQFKNN